MIEFNQLDQVKFRHADGVVVALGAFDGVHRAHQAIILEAIRIAKEKDGRAAVFTFRNHPSQVLSPAQPPLLLTPYPIKKAILESMGVDLLIAPEFDDSLARVPAEEFINEILGHRLAARVIVAGFNFRFGRGGRGDAQMLSSFQGELFEQVRIIPRFEFGSSPLSSTRIREAILSGNLPAAELMLGRRYRLAGRVVPGDGRGRALGYPTANLEISGQPIPPRGIYGGRAFFAPGSNTGIDALIYIGAAPTFHTAGMESPIRVEVYLMNWEGDLYGRSIFVDVMCRIREDRHFDDPRDLLRQIDEDRRFLSHWLDEHR